MQKNFGESTKRKNESLRIQFWANCGMLCSNIVSTNASRCIFCDFIFRPSVLRCNPFYLNTLRVNASRVGIFSAFKSAGKWLKQELVLLGSATILLWVLWICIVFQWTMKNVKGIFAFGFNSSYQQSNENQCWMVAFPLFFPLSLRSNIISSLPCHKHFSTNITLYDCCFIAASK